jgi:hypothetical protein
MRLLDERTGKRTQKSLAQEIFLHVRKIQLKKQKISIDDAPKVKRMTPGQMTNRQRDLRSNIVGKLD